MSEMGKRLSGNAAMMMVCVRSVLEYAVQDGVPGTTVGGPLRTVHGEFYNGCFSDGFPFLGLDDLLMKMDAIFDYLGFPQNSEELRTFGGRRKLSRYTRMAREELPRLEQQWDRAAMRQRDGNRATFYIHVYSRQHGSWQGVVKWQEGRSEQRFRSVLELLCQMESVLDRQAAASGAAVCRTVESAAE